MENPHWPLILHPDGPGRTDLGAGPAAEASLAVQFKGGADFAVTTPPDKADGTGADGLLADPHTEATQHT